MKPVRVLLADDHPVYRDGLRVMLETDPNIKVVGEASLGHEAIRLVEELAPDQLLLDINLPDMDGAAVAESIRAKGCSCALMFVTMDKSFTILQQAIDLEMSGYLLKNSSAQEIIQAVQTVARGEKYFSPPVADLLMRHVRAERGLEPAVKGLDLLSPTERKVLRLIASHRISKEIADEFGVSVRTIEGHRARISRKLGLAGIHSLVKFAFEHREALLRGIPPEPPS